MEDLPLRILEDPMFFYVKRHGLLTSDLKLWDRGFAINLILFEPVLWSSFKKQEGFGWHKILDGDVAHLVLQWWMKSPWAWKANAKNPCYDIVPLFLVIQNTLQTRLTKPSLSLRLSRGSFGASGCGTCCLGQMPCERCVDTQTPLKMVLRGQAFDIRILFGLYNNMWSLFTCFCLRFFDDSHIILCDVSISL